MAVDRPSIRFVSCTMTYLECNDSEIILKNDFQIIIYKKCTNIYSLKHCFE